MKYIYMCLLGVVFSVSCMEEKETTKTTFLQGIEKDLNEFVDETELFFSNLLSWFIKKKKNHIKPAYPVLPQTNKYVSAKIQEREEKKLTREEMFLQVITKALKKKHIKVLAWCINDKAPEYPNTISTEQFQEIYNLLKTQQNKMLDNLVEIQTACTYIINNSLVTES